LSLSFNEIESLDSETFKANSKLETLWLSYTKVSTVNFLGPLVNLEKLVLDSNGLTELALDSFSTNQKLKVLSLEGNSFEFVDSAPFAPIPQLEILQLSMNKIIGIKRDFFKTLPNLKSLGIQVNRCVNAVFMNFEEEAINLAFENCFYNFENLDEITDEPIDPSTPTTTLGSASLMASKYLVFVVFSFSLLRLS
jgi:hypothetical protein